jgi:phenylpropionate dioxygenase-like ring-hydroxylating dioxygenase large terminal subunit
MKEIHFLAHTTELDTDAVKPVSQLDNKLLVKGDTTQLFNNICPHQLSRICSKKQNELKCQFHGWTWDLNGNGDINLKGTPVFKDNGLLFTDNISIKEFAGLHIEQYKLVAERVDIVNANWKNIVDLFLDVDHIPIVHKGVYEQIGITDKAKIDWSYYDWGNVQTVHDENNKLVAIWAMVYPYSMIEWQAGSLFITVCKPIGDSTAVTVFKYSDPDTSYYQDNSRIFEAAWSQDKNQAENIVMFPKVSDDTQKMHFRNYLTTHRHLLNL